MTWIWSAVSALVAVVTVLIALRRYGRDYSDRRMLFWVSTKAYERQSNSTRTYLTRVAFKSIGRHDILSADFDGDKPLKIDLGVPIVGFLGHPISDSVQIHYSGSCILVPPALIPPGAFVLAQVVTHNRPTPKLRRSLAHIPVTELGESLPNSNKKFAWGTAGSVIGLGAVAGGVDWSTEDPNPSSGYILLFLLSLLILFATLLNLVWSYIFGPGRFRLELWRHLPRLSKYPDGYIRTR